jgi:hypothetical protein
MRFQPGRFADIGMRSSPGRFADIGMRYPRSGCGEEKALNIYRLADILDRSAKCSHCGTLEFHLVSFADIGK